MCELGSVPGVWWLLSSCWFRSLSSSILFLLSNLPPPAGFCLLIVGTAVDPVFLPSAPVLLDTFSSHRPIYAIHPIPPSGRACLVSPPHHAVTCHPPSTASQLRLTVCLSVIAYPLSHSAVSPWGSHHPQDEIQTIAWLKWLSRSAASPPLPQGTPATPLHLQAPGQLAVLLPAVPFPAGWPGSILCVSSDSGRSARVPRPSPNPAPSQLLSSPGAPASPSAPTCGT